MFYFNPYLKKDYNNFEKIATEEIKSLKTKNKDSHDGGASGGGGDSGGTRWLRSSKSRMNYRMNPSQVSRIWYSATCALFKKSGNVLNHVTLLNFLLVLYYFYLVHYIFCIVKLLEKRRNTSLLGW